MNITRRRRIALQEAWALRHLVRAKGYLPPCAPTRDWREL